MFSHRHFSISNSTLFSSFLALQIMKVILTSLLQPRSMMLNASWAFCTGRSLKGKHFDSRISQILKSDGRLSSGESSIIFYRFDSSAQSVTCLVRTNCTVECGVKPWYALLFEKSRTVRLSRPEHLCSCRFELTLGVVI